MNYIVLDLEWNQAFSQKQMLKDPIPLVGEIVQIGAVKLDDGFRIVDTFKMMVSPRYYTKMHGKVAKLTHIKSKDLLYGLPFTQAAAHLKKWCGEDFVFITWGWDDIRMLRDNLVINGLDGSALPRDYNLQIIFDDQVTREKRQISLSQAMETLGLEARDAHDALNDAYNTALICSKLDMRLGLSGYGELENKYRAPVGDGEPSAVRNSFETRSAALNDAGLSRFVCASCGQTVTHGKFLAQKSDRYMATAKCACGKEYFCRLRLRKNADGTFRACFRVCDMDDDLNAYFEKTHSEYVNRRQRYAKRRDTESKERKTG